MNQQANRLFDILSICLIGVAIYILNHQVTAISDVEMGDEGFYMYQGISNFRLGLQTDWGPIYSLWYKFLSLFESDTIQLYYLNMVLMSSLPTLCLYVALRVGGLRWWSALYSSLVFHFAKINFPEGVKVSMFILLLTLLLYIFCDRRWRPTGRSANNRLYYSGAVFTLSYFVFAYIRPESVVSFGVCLVLLTASALVFRKNLLIIAGIVAVALVIFFAVGSPLSEKGESAFKQDFSYNYTMNHPEDQRLKPYNNWVDYEKMTQIIFGEKVGGFGDALRKHPGVVIKNHLLTNLRNAAYMHLGIIGQYFEPILNLPGIRAIKGIFTHTIVWLALLVGLAVVISPRKTWTALQRSVSQDPLVYLVVVSAIIAPVVASLYSMGIKIRYLPPFYFFYPIVGATLLSSLRFRSFGALAFFNRRPAMTGALPVAVYLLVIGAFLMQSWQGQTPKDLRDKYLILYAKNLTEPITDKNRIRIFDNKDQLITHIGGQAVGYAEYKRDTDFFNFIEQHQINLIIFRQGTIQYYGNDSSVQRFIHNPPPSFIRQPGAHPGDYTFIRRGLLPASATPNGGV